MKNILKISEVLQNKNGAKLRQILQISRGYFAHTGKFSLTNLGRWTIGTSVLGTFLRLSAVMVGTNADFRIGIF